MDGIWPEVLIGDVRQRLKELPTESVHMACTSPPYWGLRSYIGDSHPDTGYEIGLEATVEEWVETLVAVFREVKRVLRRDGTLWLNLGDSYACASNGRKAVDIVNDDRTFRDKPFSTVGGAIKAKDLVGQPWLLAFALRADGWWLRSAITICKNNPMPESVADRPTSATEMLFLLTKGERYFYDVDAIREPHTEDSLARVHRGRALQYKWTDGPGDQTLANDMTNACHPNGRNKRNWWVINSEPCKEAHFATFPSALVTPCILAGTSERGACPACGSPWRRTTEKSYEKISNGKYGGRTRDACIGEKRTGQIGQAVLRKNVQTTGWQPTCQCGKWACAMCEFVIEYNYGIQARNTEASSLQDLPAAVRSGQAGSEVLQSEVLLQPSEGSSSSEMRDLRKDVSTDVLSQPVLQPILFGEILGDESEELSGMVPRSEGMHPAVQAGSSDGVSGGVSDGASASDGEPSRPDARFNRSRPSHQREEGRQPDRESGVDAKEDSRHDTEGKKVRDVPRVQVRVSPPRCCPRCKTGLIHDPLPPQPAVILDPFAGSGTTLRVATKLGRKSIGIELSETYVNTIARKRTAQGGLGL